MPEPDRKYDQGLPYFELVVAPFEKTLGKVLQNEGDTGTWCLSHIIFSTNTI